MAFSTVLPSSRVIDSLPRFLFPTRRRGLLWLREALRTLGVKAPLSPGCLNDFVATAAKAAPLARSSDETYAASLRRQIEAEARFIHLWTSTDEKISHPEWSEWIAIARRHLLPRSWKIQETTVTEVHRDTSFAVPPRLVVKGTVRSTNPAHPIDSAADLPGAAILSDLKQAGDKSQ
ncbi:MAG TPA: hypothetical protein VGC34_09810 [Steroidobacteraceae bacterium]